MAIHTMPNGCRRPQDMEVLQLAWGALKQMLQMGRTTPTRPKSRKTMTRYFPSTAKRGYWKATTCVRRPSTSRYSTPLLTSS